MVTDDEGFEDEDIPMDEYLEEKKNDKVVQIEEALKYVSRYFIYHADQRLKTFRYFLFYLAAISAVFFKIYEDCKFHILLLGGFASLTVTIVFWCLECRNKQLVEIGREGCELMERELAQRLPPPVGRKNISPHEIENHYENLKIVTRSEKNRNGASYRTGLLVLFILALILHLFAVGASFYYLCISKEVKCKTRIDEPIEIKIVQ